MSSYDLPVEFGKMTFRDNGDDDQPRLSVSFSNELDGTEGYIGAVSPEDMQAFIDWLQGWFLNGLRIRQPKESNG